MHFLTPQEGELLHKLHYKPDVKKQGPQIYSMCLYHTTH